VVSPARDVDLVNTPPTTDVLVTVLTGSSVVDVSVSRLWSVVLVTVVLSMVDVVGTATLLVSPVREANEVAAAGAAKALVICTRDEDAAFTSVADKVTVVVVVVTSDVTTDAPISM
jgi:hypothetical protein